MGFGAKWMRLVLALTESLFCFAIDNRTLNFFFLLILFIYLFVYLNFIYFISFFISFLFFYLFPRRNLVLFPFSGIFDRRISFFLKKHFLQAHCMHVNALWEYGKYIGLGLKCQTSRQKKKRRSCHP